MPYKMIQVGTGGFGAAWCQQFIPPNVKDRTVEVVAAADINPDNLLNAMEHLGLPAERCYTDVRKAFAENKADFCAIVVPPAFHESIVDIALEHGVHILSEKPISDTLEASVRIAEKVKIAGLKMAVTMSHRFDQDKTALRNLLRSGRFGDLDYLVCRFTCDCRVDGAWGAFRYRIDDPLMVEGSVHHLDILADLAGAKCDTIYARTWNPAWSAFKGDSQALVTMLFGNGVHAMYEGAKTNAVGLNGWTNEYIRAECEKATLTMQNREIECFPYNEAQSNEQHREGTGCKLTLPEGHKWQNALLIEQFAKWLGGGNAMETQVEENLQSVALIFAAIQSNRTGLPVKVQEFLAAAKEKVISEMNMSQRPNQ